ncbi:MAG TPA: protein phosphatase 2C domain-containing protein [Labilithrix sp.]|jgi:protein phosphatase
MWTAPPRSGGWDIVGGLPPWLVITFVACGVLFAVAVAYGLRPARKAAALPPAKNKKKKPKQEKPKAVPIERIVYDEDDPDVTKVGQTAPRVPASTIVYDAAADFEEPTLSSPLILVSGTAVTDRGVRRKRNEDRVLVLEDAALFAVADGMGGARGGEVASTLAVETLRDAFVSRRFDGDPHNEIPRRASELVRAIESANDAIYNRAREDKLLDGMGTTICAARFAPKKQRLYIGHVGDSRLYRWRKGSLERLTTDHVMAALGVEGPGSGFLSRAVGTSKSVAVDVILAKPIDGDLYLLCSDGVTKMLDEDAIAELLATPLPPPEKAQALVEAANSRGGLDNVSAIVIRVDKASTRRDRAA